MKTSNKRPRGFAPWKPDQASLDLIYHVGKVLEDNADYLPLTLRQVFYMLVVQNILDKTEKAYKNQLIEKVGRARRAGMVPMDAIRDGGFSHSLLASYADADDLQQDLITYAGNAKIDRQHGQDRRIMLWCEAAGMLPQLERVGHRYGIEAASSGGFDSITTKHAMAKHFAMEPTLVLHIGDLDPSGVHMFSSLEEDIVAFTHHYSGDVDFERIAVTPAQVDHYDLPTAPPKATDKRKFEGSTTQCEALRPEQLAGIMDQAILDHLDIEQYNEMLNREDEMQQEIIRRLK